MPPGAVIPELAYPDVRQAVGWLCRAFGFVERLRIGDHRAQLSFSEGSIIVTQQGPDSGARPPGGSDHSIMVRVADVVAHYRRAMQAGAPIVSAPADYPYGERQYSVDDLAGHRWTFSQTIEDVDPKEWGGEVIE
jgi:uncharacterized glyoxalase superfamily protein PhnB